MRLYASNLLKPESILSVGDALTQLSFATKDQLADENLGIGNEAWIHLSSFEEEYDPKPFYNAVRGFYVSTLQKMLKKFPFGDSILKDLDVINPDKVCSYSYEKIKSLA